MSICAHIGAHTHNHRSPPMFRRPSSHTRSLPGRLPGDEACHTALCLLNQSGNAPLGTSNMDNAARRRVVLPAADAKAAAVSVLAPRSSSASPNQVLAIVCVGICLANLDLFIVNVGLPNIGRDFKDAMLEDMSWILNGYAIAYAALLVFFGSLAERYRRNRSFQLGVALFTAASAACSAANNVEALVAFRLVQAAGAAPVA